MVTSCVGYRCRRCGRVFAHVFEMIDHLATSERPRDCYRERIINRVLLGDEVGGAVRDSVRRSPRTSGHGRAPDVSDKKVIL